MSITLTRAATKASINIVERGSGGNDAARIRLTPINGQALDPHTMTRWREIIQAVPGYHFEQTASSVAIVTVYGYNIDRVAVWLNRLLNKE